MKEALLSLAPSDIRAISVAIETGRLSPPYLESSIERFVKRDKAVDIAAAIHELEACGMTPVAIARSLDLLAFGIAANPPLEDLVDLVTTGPELGGVANRDTSVVVCDLFRNAESSVVVVGYAIHHGRKVFQALADRMMESPDLKVRMYLDIQRDPGDTSAPSEVVSRFVTRFRTCQWPLEKPLPIVYFDPRSLSLNNQNRAALHAKCVIVDSAELFVSSANFTEAAQQKNIEVGLLLNSPALSDRLLRFLDKLVEGGRLERAM